jgi:hypothetical protein
MNTFAGAKHTQAPPPNCAYVEDAIEFSLNAILKFNLLKTNFNLYWYLHNYNYYLQN